MLKKITQKRIKCKNDMKINELCKNHMKKNYSSVKKKSHKNK